MRNQILMACWALCCLLLVNCTDDAFLETSQSLNGRFELTVSKGDAATRLELGEDGLSTMWEPGDKLVLVDKARSQAPITLSCTLTEPAETAKFVVDGAVPVGDYWVIYNYNSEYAYDHCTFLSIDEINKQDKLTMYEELSIAAGDETANITLKHLYAMVRVNLQNIPADFAANGTLKIGMYSSKKGFPMYKYFGNELVNAEYGIDFSSFQYVNNYFKSTRRRHNVSFGYFSYTTDPVWATLSTPLLSDIQEYVALILPEDLRGEDVYFYVAPSTSNAIQCYEIKKSDIKFEAGKRYTVNLDMSVATRTFLIGDFKAFSNTEYGYMFSLSTPAECRAAAYECCYEPCYYQLTNDINFKDEAYFPISTNGFWGNGYKLSNITLDWEGEDNVGLIRWENDTNEYLISQKRCNVYDLTLENVVVNGGSFVGALGGYNISASNCKVIGSSVIKGTGDYVGGIVGFNRIFVGAEFPLITTVSIGEYTKVYGKNYTGGIVGAYREWWQSGGTSSQTISILSACTSWAEIVSTGDCVGGIFGKIGGTMLGDFISSSYWFNTIDAMLALQSCINKGNVTGVNYVGGIGGYMGISAGGPENTFDRAVIMNSANEADVTGVSNVGGIVGYSMASINTSYSIKKISASSTKVGGIVGGFYVSDKGIRIANCYSIADLTVGTNGFAGGIIGSSEFSSYNNVITNCYFAGTNPTNCGIIGSHGVNSSGNGICDMSNCLTTLSSLGTTLDTSRSFPDSYDSNITINCPDIITNSFTSVSSIKANRGVINGDNAYSSNTWSEYDYECLKFINFSVDIDSPDYEEETIN